MDENSTQPATPSPAEPDQTAPGKPARRAPARKGRSKPLVRIGSPDSVLAVIPGLLGFHPARSLVVIGAGPPRGRIEVAFRYDLPEPPNPAGVAKIATHAASILARHQLPLAIAVGYGPGPMVTPVADALVAELRRAGITLHDMLRVENGRYWSYSCPDPRCCPPEGVHFDASSHPAAATLTAAGNKALRNRAALAATLAPLGGQASEAMRPAIRQAERRITDAIQKRGVPARRRDAIQQVINDGLREVSEAISAYRRGDSITDASRIAWLAVSLDDLRVRDDAWARMMPEHAGEHLRLWTDVLRRAPARYAAAPASLLAFTAWQSGNGALANVAVERALAADPGYSMALLLQEAVTAGFPPSAARLPMTPEEVAASYATSADPASSGVTIRTPSPATRKPAGGARRPPSGPPSPATRARRPSGPSRKPAGRTKGAASRRAR
jgi:hypothetical protein